MTADHNAAARELLTIHCGDPPCTFMDERSCGCFKATIAALDRARQEGAEEMRRRAAEAVEEYAREREENAPFEDSADHTERALVYAKHVRRAAARVAALSAQPEEG
jgi:hypothetical protein